MSESLLIDSTAEDATNVQVDLFAYPFAVTGMRFPTPPLQPRWAVPDDADGDALVASRYQNREITITLEIVPTETTAAARAVTAEAALASLADKVTKINREAGTLRRTMPTGKVQTFDLLTAADGLDPSWDIEWDVGQILRLELKFTAKPFWRGVEISGTTDSFVSNTIADYAVTGTGASISGGKIVVSSTSAKTWLHNARRFIDGTVTRAFRTGASVTTWTDQVIGKAIDASNHLCVQMTQAGTIAIVKTVRGTPTTLASTAGANLSTATGYWLRLVMCSNVLTGELWTTDPVLGGSPARTVTWALAGADITTYGEGVSGLTGFAMTPGGTDWTYDDYSALWMVQEKTLPVLTMTVPGAIGDVPALGRLVVTDASGANQAWAVWGLRSRSYDISANAGLFYQAESRTPMGTAAVATVTGASGGGSNNAVTEGSLTPRWSAVLSTQAAGAGAHLTHTGTYRMFARILRPTTNAGTVGVALEWLVGDARTPARNAAEYFTPDVMEGTFTIADLGIVDVPSGSARWEGRIVGRSTVAGDDVTVDCFWFVPAELSGDAGGLVFAPTPTAYIGRDEVNQTSGALGGKALPIGGTWSTSGATTDFTVDTVSKAALRTTTNDDGTSPTIGRVAVASSTAGMASQAASVDVRFVGRDQYLFGGVTFRYTDIRNYAQFVLTADPNYAAAYVTLRVVVAGAASFLSLGGGAAITPIFAAAAVSQLVIPSPTSYVRLMSAVTAEGNYRMTVGVGDAVANTFSGQADVLGAAGALARGSAGICDTHFDSAAVSRYYDNFACWSLPSDAACFANQSIEFAHDGVTRKDAAGTTPTSPSRRPGDLLVLPPATPQNRCLQVIAKMSRGYVESPADTSIDDLGSQLYVTPRGVLAPS